MTDAHCHVSCGDSTVREFLIGRDFIGIHPWDASLHFNGHGSGDLASIRVRLHDDPRLGVGEIGLDRLKDRVISRQMREIFESQLQLASKFRRPVVLHGAKCWGQVVKAVQATRAAHGSSWLFHGFSRSDGLIPDIVALNGYISVGPAVLNDHAVNYRKLVKKIPLDRLLLETDRTDAPEKVLNPQTGKPLSVRDVLLKTSELLDLSAEELERLTDENAKAFQMVSSN